jgi:rhodanese-related sulfurtransferase
MYRRLIIAVALLGLVGAAGTAWSYDHELAEGYAKLFEPVVGAKAGKALHLMKPDALMNKIHAKEPVATLDVRTPAESGVFTSVLPGALVIPINELFVPENLDLIPTDKPVVVFCKSGTRATAAGTALRHIGFDNVYILKGGFQALSVYLDPKTAGPPPVKQ